MEFGLAEERLEASIRHLAIMHFHNGDGCLVVELNKLSNEEPVKNLIESICMPGTRPRIDPPFPRPTGIHDTGFANCT